MFPNVRESKNKMGNLCSGKAKVENVEPEEEKAEEKSNVAERRRKYFQ